MSLEHVPERDRQFAGAIPELYHRHLGPLFFEPYAREMAPRVASVVERGGTVLEIAAGTGIVTRALRAALPTSVEIVATDLNRPMLDIARRHVGDASGVRWEIADATALPFAEASFDAVVCQFGVMFFPDKPRAAAEAFRVLKPGGSWLFSVWLPGEDDRIQVVTDRAIAECFGGDPPEFRTPFSFHDSQMLRALAAEVGFVGVTIDDVGVTAESESAYHAAVGIVRGSPIGTTILERGVDPDVVTRHVAEALARELGDHPMRGGVMARIVFARRPGNAAVREGGGQ